MKQLILVRHANAASEDVNVADMDRPLSERGHDDAQQVAKRLRDKDLKLDALISSPANRAITTARLMAEFLGFTKSQIIEDHRIFENTVDDLMNVITETADTVETLMLVGHNPALSSLAAYLTNDSAVSLSTCSVLSLNSESNWIDFKFHCASINWQEIPKET